jgi:hypothetical protein
MAETDPNADADHAPDAETTQATARAILHRTTITLSASDSLAIAEALLNPSPPSPRLHRVAERYMAFMNQPGGER